MSYEDNFDASRCYYSFGTEPCEWCEQTYKYGVCLTIVNTEAHICVKCANTMAADIIRAAVDKGTKVDFIFTARDSEIIDLKHPED